MAVGGLFKYAQRALFAKPAPERQLLKVVKGRAIRRVVELGVESFSGTVELLTSLVKHAQGETVWHTAIDPFDERPAGAERLDLVGAYRGFVATGARSRLAPGPLAQGVVNEANSLGNTDLLLLSRVAAGTALGEAWYFVPRMCHPATLVLQRVDGADADDPGEWEPVPLDVVAARAAAEGPASLAA